MCLEWERRLVWVWLMYDYDLTVLEWMLHNNMLPFESITHSGGLNHSQMRSSTGQDLCNSQVGNLHSLPPITQPILARYRHPRLLN